ncbi:uncharacterized protein VTP21DRAFT_2897 [Calcarisporiella thermophila]|uniref:uncharacterized protein n=1 Tax=Calcarisporiella thermophila TaxID=911321 RepID=UPI00374478C7
MAPSLIIDENCTGFEHTIAKELNRVSDKLREISLKIHDNPELAWKETLAHDLLTSFLESEGFLVQRHAFVSTGFKATFERGKGPTVAFCSEYDALPGIGHGCGHNLIAISGLACAIGVKKMLQEQEINGKVVLLGTPAEESSGGKIAMIDAGAFHDIDFGMMLHPAHVDLVFPTILAIQGLDVEYFGRAAHAAGMPWEGVNALDAAVQAYNSISALRQQIMPTCRIHGIFTNGGRAVNIIPDYASLKFIIRACGKEELEALCERVEKCFRAAAVATGCRVEMHKSESYSNLLVNSVLGERFTYHMGRNGIKYPSQQEQRNFPPAGSTDFGNVSHVIPALHPGFSIYTKFPPHTPEFREAARTPAAHTATLRASKCLALTAVDVMKDPKLLDAMRREWQDTVRSKTI